jgi:hypothetical protein
VRHVDQQKLAALRATLDPLTLTPLRNAVIHSAWGRGKIDLPPGIARKLRDTPVYVGSDIRQSKFRKDLPKSMRVERVPDTARNQKFKARDERQQEQQADIGRKQDTGRVSGEVNKDNKDARKLDQQQRKDTRDQEKAARAQTHGQDKAQPKDQQGAQGVRVGKPEKSEAKPRTHAAPKPQEQNQNPPTAAGGKGHGGGKGKGKKP